MHHNSTLPHLDFFIFIFDKDGTITPPNQPMTEEFAKSFRHFIDKRRSVILTARDFNTCESQILTPIGKWYEHLLALACSNGSEIYTHDGNNWNLVSKLPGTLHDHMDTIKGAEETLRDVLKKDSLHFEFRSEGMGAFVCIPRDSTKEDRDAFDSDKQKRLEAIEKIRHLFPSSYEIIPGGQTSIDVSLMNKKHWLEHVIKYLGVDTKEIVYFGDSFENGNDTPILDIEDVTTISVQDPENTLSLIHNL